MNTIYEIRRKNVEHMIEHSESRRAFAMQIGIEYNLLNQYLSHKKPKNIGDKLALKVTTGFGLPDGWLDTMHDSSAIKNIIKKDIATKYVAQNHENSTNILNHPNGDQKITAKITPIQNNLIMIKGQEVEVTESVEQFENVFVPNDVINPIAYKIKGTGYQRPYRNGYGVICEYEGMPISGEDVIIFCNDGKIFAGEFLYEQDVLISIASITGDNEEILKSNIKRISPVKAFLSPSQIKSI